MTHHELTRDDRHGWASPCPGELAHKADFPDEFLKDGRSTNRTISVWECRDCGLVISAAGMTLLNVYPPPPALLRESDAADGRG